MDSCSTEPTDKKEFGTSVYKYLKENHGTKNSYSVIEIVDTVRALGYPNEWECWALVAFMLPANAGEYFRTRETPIDVLNMKRAFIREMTDGARETLIPSRRPVKSKNIELEKLENHNLITLMGLGNADMLEIGFELVMF